MSTVAVFIALGGSSYAAVKLSAKSVGERELKDSAVTTSKLAKGAVTADRLAPGAAAAGPRGARGAEGPAGPQGERGPQGAGLGAPEPWKALPVANGWSPYLYDPDLWEVAGYRKDALGYVELRGLLTKVNGTPSGVIATLPVGYRPKHGRLFLVGMGEPSQYGRINIFADGNVQWSTGPTGENDFTSLEGIRFSVD